MSVAPDPSTSEREISIIPQEFLEEEFRFDPGNHVVTPIGNYRGRVVEMFPRRLDQERLTLKGNPFPDHVELVDLFVEDPLLKHDLDGYRLVRNYVQKLGAVMLADGVVPGQMLRTEAVVPAQYNRYTRAWLAAPQMQAMEAWRTLVPTAVALDYLLEPKEGRIVKDRNKQLGRAKGKEVPMSKEVAMLLGFGDDAVGIRERAVGMEEIAVNSLIKNYKPGRRKHWLSLASGTAEPSIAACSAAQKSGGNIMLDLVDLDAQALSYSRGNASKYGFSNLRTHNLSILSETLADELQSVIKRTPKYDVVEALGFLEYLRQGGDEVEALKNQIPVKASDFVRRSAKLVKPDGGVLILGNMIIPRPQDFYVFNVVDWPLINARSEEDLLGILDEAGILNDPNAEIIFYRVQDVMQDIHLYDIVQVTLHGELQGHQLIT